MRGHRLAAAAIVCGIGLAACRDEPAQPPAAGQAHPSIETGARASSGYTIRGRIHPSLPEHTFILSGAPAEGASEVLRVTRIDIRRETAAGPLQSIIGLDTQTPIVAGMPAFELIDMNFDGYQDMRIIEHRSAGPNTPYLNWLFDPVAKKFVESQALNEIPSPQFDPVRREIRSAWRDGATRYGTSIYTYADGRPLLVRKEERTYRSPGVYLLTVSRLVDGAWTTVDQREVREPSSPDAASPPARGK